MRDYLLSRIKNNKLKPSYSIILDKKLILGNEDTAYSSDTLKTLGVTHILSVGRELLQLFKDKFTYLQLEMDDSLKQNLTKFIASSTSFIGNGQVVYVHCSAGASRSPSIIIAYLIKTNRWSYQKAFDYVKSKRSTIHPNSNF